MIYISRLFINKLISITDIINVISSKISIKKIGNYYKSFCPFHEEKNASFFINKDKQFFYCFGCKSYGNVISFLMKINNYNFIDAIKELCNINNIKVKNYSFNNNINYKKKKDLFFNLTLKFNKVYIKSLFFNLNINYIKNFFINRNIDYKSIYNFSIGFSCNILVNKFINNLNIKYKEFLFKLGFLIKDKNGNFIDRLYNRIVFPIYNLKGDIVAFGGRCLINNKFFCKYINSCNNIYFTKKKCLFNLFNIIKNNNRLDKILIVEGYIDVIMLSKFGINYSVALLGSSVCKNQIDILFFYTNKIIFCFDGDKSSSSFIINIINLLISYVNENRMFFFVFLPNNEDPDSLIKKEGKILFEKRVNNALSIFDVIFKIFSFKNLYTYNSQISFISSLMPIIYKINCPIIKSYFKFKINNKLGILNYKIFDKFLLLNKNKKNKKIKITIIRCLISLLLKYPYLSNNVNLYDKLFINKKIIPGLLLFLDIVNLCINNRNITISEIIYKYKNSNIKFYLIKLFLWNYFPKNINYNLIFNDALIKLKLFIIKNILKKVLINNTLYELTLNQKIKIWNLIKFKKLNF